MSARERQRLVELSATLRESLCAALRAGSLLAHSLDEVRCQVELLLMLPTVDPTEYWRAVVRAQRMLDAWHAPSSGESTRSG
jgi:hypothetical protein